MKFRVAAGSNIGGADVSLVIVPLDEQDAFVRKRWSFYRRHIERWINRPENANLKAGMVFETPDPR